jgi:hypothetical protein
MDNAFIYVNADCTKNVSIKPRIANNGGVGFYTLQCLDPAGPSQNKNGPGQVAFDIAAAALQGAQFKLARFALFVRPATIDGKDAVLQLRVDQGPTALGGVVTDQSGNQVQIQVDANGETTASAAIPNGQGAAILIGIKCQ